MQTRTPTRDPTVKIMCAKTIKRHHDNVTDCLETPRRCPCLLGYPITMIMYVERLMAMTPMAKIMFTGRPMAMPLFAVSTIKCAGKLAP